MERKSEFQLLTIYTDNIKELFFLLEQWEKENGVSAQYIEIYISAQNRIIERVIQTNEQNIKFILDDIELLIEFWYETINILSYVRNRIYRRPKIIEKNIDIIIGKLINLEYRVSPEEAWLGELSKIYKHIKIWGYKMIFYILLKSISEKTNKLISFRKKGIFINYNKYIIIYYQIYAPDMYKMIISNNIDFYENIPGNSIGNYQL
jgi:hypothetical protein